jgi:hypothetical protein
MRISALFTILPGKDASSFLLHRAHLVKKAARNERAALMYYSMNEVMMGTVKTVAAFAALLLAAAAAQGEVKEISFRNKKDNTVKLYCKKSIGKIQTTISCDDKPFTPSAEWEIINAEKVCFQHKDGRIRACDELSRQGGMKKSHVCFDKDKQPVPFTPGKEWKRLAGNNKICAEEQERFDVPRNMTMPSLNF